MPLFHQKKKEKKRFWGLFPFESEKGRLEYREVPLLVGSGWKTMRFDTLLVVV